MEDDENYLKINDQICNTLILDKNINKNYLEFFGLSDENFSKTLRSQLEKFVEEIKYNKEIFTTFEKEKLLFTEFTDDKPKKTFSQNDDQSIQSMKLYNNKNLDILLLNLKNLNHKLKIEKEKKSKENLNLANRQTEKNSPIDDNTFKINFEFVFSKIQKIINQNQNNRLDYKENNYSTTNKNPNHHNHINSSDIDHVLSLKKNILELNEKNKNLKQEKLEYEKKLNKFCNLPSDINKIKEMIRLKKEEYLSLK